MSRKWNFLAGLAAAALTFGTLSTTLGSAYYNKLGHPCHAMEHCCMHESSNKAAERVMTPANHCATDSMVK